MLMEEPKVMNALRAAIAKAWSAATVVPLSLR
jgi:hypothetical protein